MSPIILQAVIFANIVLLSIAAINLIRRRHIINLLIGISVGSLVILEVGKFALLFNLVFQERIIGLGFSFLSLFWLIASMSILPVKEHSVWRVFVSMVLGIASLVFFIIGWINPFIEVNAQTSPIVFTRIEWYFFMALILNLTFTLTNIERSVAASQNRNVRFFFAGALFSLVPYILLSTYALSFAQIPLHFILFTSGSIFIGSLCFLALSRAGISHDAIRETTAIQSSLTLFLIGGYLLVIGAFIKLFQAFGFNLQTLFSFLTTIFLLVVFLFLVFSSALKTRIRDFFLRYFSRQKYDWQKIWEDFTFKISLVTDLAEIEHRIKEAIVKIMHISGVELFVFAKEVPFEDEFADWLLRRADVFKVTEIFDDAFGKKYPQARTFFRKHKIGWAAPLYGDHKIIGLIGFELNNAGFIDRELVKVLSLQASSVIVNCLAYQKLHEAEKKESIYRMSSFVIHDVKNYINNLSVLVTNKDKMNKPEFQQDALFTLEATITRMGRLVDEFRALRGDLNLQKQECRLKDIVDETIKELGNERLKDIVLTVAVDDAVRILVDRHYLHKVVLNLIINSLEAMQSKGVLAIASETQNGFTILTVKDSGAGMSKEFLEQRLFKPFQTTKMKGMGIGLYQCKTIIEAHGGSIEAQSVEGKGTTFVVRLPLA